MAITGGVSEALAAGQSLAVADRVLIDPDPGSLVSRVDELIGAVTGDRNAEEVCRTLIRQGMNFAGRDAEIVGYGADEAESALDKVLAAIRELRCPSGRGASRPGGLPGFTTRPATRLRSRRTWGPLSGRAWRAHMGLGRAEHPFCFLYCEEKVL